MKVILFFLLLLTKLEDISGTSSENKMALRNNHTLSQQQLSVMESLVGPIPKIIAQLGHLASNSTHQFDWALNWVADLTSDKTKSSKHIDYTHGLQMTLQQLSLYLTKALKTSKTHAAKMALDITSASSNFGSLQRFLTKQEEMILFIDLVSLSLNRLKGTSENIVFLSNQSSSDLQEVTNSTKYFVDGLKVIQSKVKSVSATLEGKRVNELEKEIDSLNQRQEQLSYNETQYQNYFYRSLNRFITAVRKQKDYRIRTCLENVAITANYSMTGDFKVNCPGKSTRDQLLTFMSMKNAKLGWISVIKNLSQTKEEFENKREEYHKLSNQIPTHENTKNFLKIDIDLLVETVDSIDKLRSEIETLVNGWNNLTSNCLSIRSNIYAINTTLLTSTITDSVKFNLTEGLVSQVIEQLKAAEEDIRSVGRIVEDYVNIYNSDLAASVLKLENNVTKSGDEDVL